MFDYDAELRRYHVRLLAAAAITADDRVLDIGCGAGQTTRDAARIARSGRALGVDVSASMVHRAREAADRDGPGNVDFERADAEVHRFEPEAFTVGLSRFGTMFFTDPVAAFSNLGTAMRPGARVVQLVWQGHDQQEWFGATRQALTGRAAPTSGLGGGAFSLADPAVTTSILAMAGFTAIELTDVREQVYYGPDAAGARDALVGLGMVDSLVADLEPTATTRALDRLMAMLDDHDTGEGVWFDAAAWLVTARRG